MSVVVTIITTAAVDILSHIFIANWTLVENKWPHENHGRRLPACMFYSCLAGGAIKLLMLMSSSCCCRRHWRCPQNSIPKYWTYFRAHFVGMSWLAEVDRSMLACHWQDGGMSYPWWHWHNCSAGGNELIRISTIKRFQDNVDGCGIDSSPTWASWEDDSNAIVACIFGLMVCWARQGVWVCCNRKQGGDICSSDAWPGKKTQRRVLCMSMISMMRCEGKSTLIRQDGSQQGQAMGTSIFLSCSRWIATQFWWKQWILNSWWDCPCLSSPHCQIACMWNKARTPCARQRDISGDEVDNKQQWNELPAGATWWPSEKHCWKGHPNG